MAQGVGLEHIGPRKLKRLDFAAKVWIQVHKWDGDYRIIGASVGNDGMDYNVNEILEIN